MTFDSIGVTSNQRLAILNGSPTYCVLNGKAQMGWEKGIETEEDERE